MTGRKSYQDEVWAIQRMLQAEYPLIGTSMEDAEGNPLRYPSALLCSQPDYGEGGAALPRGQGDGRLRQAGAKFKDKKKIKTQDGDTTTVYEYSERQVQNRHREKAKRIEKLRKNMSDLRAQVKRDLAAKDPSKRLTALAVALMDETYERVGNDQSAKDGHFGVTGWLVKHISFGRGRATLKYVGKSGVKQEKVVTDAKILKVLREAVAGKGKDDKILCEGEDCSITAKEVNEYLKPYDVTAKDLRGFHANEEMKQHLQAIRSKGQKLPDDKKEREKLLKEEFKQALEEAAKAVGHEASTLRSQYLVPGLEENYVKDGTVMKSLDVKKAAGVPDKYNHIDFKPPKAVAAEARKGLEYRQKASPSNRGGLTPGEAGEEGIGSGVQRAVNLKNRDGLAPDTVRQMHRFFSRHKKNKAISPEHKGKPWNDKGYVAWLLWGGDPGQAWAAKVVRQMDSADQKKTASDLLAAWGPVIGSASEDLVREVHQRVEDLIRAYQDNLDLPYHDLQAKVSAPFGEWFESTFRIKLSRTPRGGKQVKEQANLFLWSARNRVLMTADRETGLQQLVQEWQRFKPFVPDLVRLFSDAGGEEIVREHTGKYATFVNARGVPTKSFMRYVKNLEAIFASLTGWRRKALQGQLRVVLAGPTEFRGTAAGVYRSGEDTMYVRATPAVMKRDGGTYGSPEYILIHELGHRYERFHLSSDFDSWVTTRYSLKEGESFAELFALGHFGIRSEGSREFGDQIDRFEHIMSGGGRLASSDLERAWGRLMYGTKTHGEREDEETDKLVKPAPRKKPPRMDLRRHLVDPDKDRDSDDSDEKQDKKDQSQNYKDVGGSVGGHIVKAAEPPLPEDSEGAAGTAGGASASWVAFMQEKGDDKVVNPDTGKPAKLKSLKGAKGKALLRKMFEEWIKESEEAPEEGASDPAPEEGSAPTEPPASEQPPESGDNASPQGEKAPPTPQQQALSKIKGALRKSLGGKIPKATQEELASLLDGMSEDEIGTVVESFAGQVEGYTKRPPQGRAITQMVGRVNEPRPTDPAELGKFVAQSVWVENTVADPTRLGGRKADGSNVVSDGKIDPEKMKARAIEAKRAYMGLDSDLRQKAAAKLVAQLEKAEPNTPEHAELTTMLRGVALANLANGEDTRGLPSQPPMMHNLYHALRNAGQEDLLLGPVEDFYSPKGQSEVRRAIKSLSDQELVQFAKDDELYKPFGDLLEREDMNAYQKQLARDVLADLATGEMGVMDPMIAAALADAGKEADPKARKEVREKAVAQAVKEKVHGKTVFSLVDEAVGNVTDQESKAEVQKSLVTALWERMNQAVRAQVPVKNSGNPAAALADLAAERGDPSVLGDAKTDPPLVKPKQAHLLDFEYSLVPWAGRLR